MARKKIREYSSKQLLKQHLARIAGIQLPLQCAQVRKDTNFADLLDANPWMKATKLVVKPDMLFGKRGKNDLVGLNLDATDVEAFIKARMGRVVDMNGVSGPIEVFIIEPFVPHDEEYYLCIQSKPKGDEISFSECGGVDIEENWDKVKTVMVPTLEEATPDLLAPLISTLPLELKAKMADFISGCFKVYQDLDFSLMEMNPFTLDASGSPFPLDMRGELDDTAGFRSGKKWGDVEFPLPFGRTLTAAEELVYAMDEQTGASLKLAILNPKGRIWTMVAGGGASVIYADTVGDLGYAHELGNYGEYSGGPNTQETYNYAKTLLNCATTNPDGKARALIIGGGIANFTDVAATFKGIIQAITEKAADIKAVNMRLFVRRGGPNYQAGLKLMKDLGAQTGLPIEVYGPEASMTGICKKAIDFIKASDS